MASLCKAMGQKFEAAKIRKLVSVQKEFSLGDVDGLSWSKLPDGPEIHRFIRKHGIEILDKELTIDVSTYHSSKGRETDVSIIMTDCYPKVTHTLKTKPDTERRLCYVAFTRAREKVIVVNAQDPMNQMKPITMES